MFGITKLGLLNYFIQFLFIRIYASYECNGSEDRKDWITNGYGVLYFVLPLSGWFNNFICLNKGGKLKYKPFKNV